MNKVSSHRLPVVFLDFDGVTHPEVCKTVQLFNCLPLIERVLRQHLAVDVVISSSWRLHHPLSELRAFFSEDVAHRVVGVTPCEAVRRDLPAPQHVRERECRRWLELHGPDRPWVAIDDVPWLFTPGCPHLLLTDHRAGFSLANASHLHALLQRLSS